MQNKVRQPIQQRSIETKRKIVLSGYQLFATKGYYKTNTAQIAKHAGVSTGIVYGYFRDKKAILLEVINEYIKNVYDPIFALIDNLGEKEDIPQLAEKIIVLAEKLHKKNCDIHRELNSVAQSDEEINKTFVSLQDEVTKRFATRLKELNYKNITNENIHLAMNLIETYVHEIVYDKHEYINYENFKQSVIYLIVALFKNKV